MTVMNHASIRAQEVELDIVKDLEKELKACVAILKTVSPVIEHKEYSSIVASITRLRSEISKISGLDSIRQIELYAEKQNLKSEINPNVSQPEDPKQITPTIVTEL